MKVIVRGKDKYAPAEAIRLYAVDKLQKLDQYFSFRDSLEATVLCSVYDSYQEVEITIPTRNIILRAEVKNETIVGAIDLAIDKLESQIRRHKSKIYKSMKHREGISSYYANQSDFDIEKMKSEIKATNLVRSKQVDLQPMSVDDAILQMEMLGHDFYIFMNIETNKVSVVYLREDSNYGVIDTNY